MNVGYLIFLEGDPYDCIQNAARLGFKCGQISVWADKYRTPEAAERIAAACRDFDFTITAVWCGWSGPADWSYPGMYQSLGLVPDAYRARRVDEILAGAELAHRLGVKNIVTHIGYMPDDPMNRVHIEIVQATRYICAAIAPRGQRFLFETGEMLPTTLLRFIDEVALPNVGVNLDPANFVINGRANPTDAAMRLAPYIYGMHGKDALHPVDRAPKGKEVKLGDGVVDFPAVLAILKKEGKLESVTIEYEVKKTPEYEAALLSSKAYLEEIIANL